MIVNAGCGDRRPRDSDRYLVDDRAAVAVIRPNTRFDAVAEVFKGCTGCVNALYQRP